MSYATLDYYKNTYLGSADTDANITKWLSRASDDIDIACLYQVPATPTAAQTALLQKACCVQAENYVINGDGLAESASLSVGSFSVSNSSCGSSGSSARPVLVDGAVRFLVFTGFYSRCIGYSR